MNNTAKLRCQKHAEINDYKVSNYTGELFSRSLLNDKQSLFFAKRSPLSIFLSTADGRLGKSLRSSTSSSRSSRAPYHTSQRSMRRSASSGSLGSMAGKDGDRVDDEPSEQSEQSNAFSGNILTSKAVNKVPCPAVTAMIEEVIFLFSNECGLLKYAVFDTKQTALCFDFGLDRRLAASR